MLLIFFKTEAMFAKCRSSYGLSKISGSIFQGTAHESQALLEIIFNFFEINNADKLYIMVSTVYYK